MNGLIEFGLILTKALFVVITCLSMVPVLVWLERKGSALMQDRIGPNRAAIGFIRLGGLIHLIADSVKLLSKEHLIPKGVHFFHYMLAPILIAGISLMVMAVVPFADVVKINDYQIPMQVLNIDAGLLWYFALTSLMVYGVVLAGWSSNNKYSLLGGTRSGAQLISYELPLGLSVVGILMIFGTVHLNEIVKAQGNLLFGFLPMWGVFIQPLGAIVFIICAFAETNRAPFDLAEGESEIVGGFHTEYSGMLFGLFFMAEYVALVVASAMIVTLFFGGWQIPWMSTDTLTSMAPTMAPVMAIVGGFIAFILAFLFHKYYQTNRGRFNDIRDKEGLVYSIVSAIVGIIMILKGILLFSFGLPEWAAPLVTMGAQLSFFLGKVFFFCWLFVWVRWTLPRFRYDQLMYLGWKSLMPLALLNIFITGIFVWMIGT